MSGVVFRIGGSDRFSRRRSFISFTQTGLSAKCEEFEARSEWDLQHQKRSHRWDVVTSIWVCKQAYVQTQRNSPPHSRIQLLCQQWQWQEPVNTLSACIHESIMQAGRENCESGTGLRGVRVIWKLYSGAWSMSSIVWKVAQLVTVRC